MAKRYVVKDRVGQFYKGRDSVTYEIDEARIYDRKIDAQNSIRGMIGDVVVPVEVLVEPITA
jgi:hypothetical protein